MSKRTKLLLFFTLIAGIIIGIIAAARFDLLPHANAADAKKDVKPGAIQPAPAALDLQNAFASVAEHVKPCVVNISTSKTVELQSNPFMDNKDMQNFFGKDFQFQFGMPGEGDSEGQKFKQKSLGSGFVIRSDGYIVTNAHVVLDMDKITVKFPGGEKEYEAKVIGTDKNTDLAVIKVDTENKLPAVTLGDSDKVRVGDWAIAIGNPFGLENSVTAGIVSAKGRFIDQGPYDDFIQTDAAINPGNSGGPLVNISGEIIGVNTLIYSTSGGYNGVGFAIPIDMAKDVADEIIDTGRVSRGWLGITFDEMTEKLARAYGLDEAKGVIITGVLSDTPAKKAGLREEDIILKLNGVEIKDGHHLQHEVGTLDKGADVKVTLLREGKEKVVTVTLGERPEDFDKQGKPVEIEKPEKSIGLDLKTLTPALAKQIESNSDTGAVVTGVEPDSPADSAEFQQGDIIVKADKQAVDSASDFKKIISKAKPGDEIVVVVERRGYNKYLVLTIPEK
jgi:serine protease Do